MTNTMTNVMLVLTLVLMLVLIVTVTANEPNGFSRRDHSLEDPTDEIKTKTFYLEPGHCRAVYITEDTYGENSRRTIESMIYTKVESNNWISVSIAGAAVQVNDSNNGASTINAPKTMMVEHVSWWPDLMICNLNGEMNIEFTVSYANNGYHVNHVYGMSSMFIITLFMF